MRKLTIVLSILFIFIFSFSNTTFAVTTVPYMSADGVVLMDGNSGQVLYSKNPDEQYPPASTTKIMTTLLALENCNLDEKVTISATSAGVDPSSSRAGLREGEIVTIRDLLYGLQFVSGNDCAVALAEYIGGSIENFALMMNQRAKDLGCKNTNFVNPNGLYDAAHRTTAYDIALIMKELMNHSDYSKIATSTAAYKIVPSNNKSVTHTVYNENKMATGSSQYRISGFEGGKTGYTTQSQHSYVVSASRDGQRYIVAWMHSSVNSTVLHYTETIQLLKYAFSNYQTTMLYKKGDFVINYKTTKGKTIPLMAAEDFSYTSAKGTTSKPAVALADTVDLTDKVFAKDDIVAQASITVEDQQVGLLKLSSGADNNTALSAVSSAITNGNTSPMIKFIITALKYIFLTTFILFGLLVVFIVIARIYVSRRNRKRKKRAIMGKYKSKYRK